MKVNIREIQARIRQLEEQRAKLLPLRKEEIFAVLTASGGLTLDNRLLAGLAIYAKDPANKDSNFLKELMELGKLKIPRRRKNRSANRFDTESHNSQSGIYEKPA